MGQAVAFTRVQRQWRIELGNHECSLVTHLTGRARAEFPARSSHKGKEKRRFPRGKRRGRINAILAYWKSFIALTSVWSTPSTSGIPTKPQARISLVFIDGSV